MDLPIRYFDRPEYKKMVFALLGLTRCTHLIDNINMTVHYLKIQLDNQAALAKSIILKNGSKWAAQNQAEVQVDHFSPKNSRFAVDIYGILLNLKSENESFGIFLDTKRVWDKTVAFSKDYLLETLKVWAVLNFEKQSG